MKVSYDPKRDIIRIKFQDGKYDISRETDEGVVIDMTKDNKILAIKIANISQIQKEVWNLSVDDRKKISMIDACGEIEFRMVEGSDEFIQLECLLAKFWRSRF